MTKKRTSQPENKIDKIYSSETTEHRQNKTQLQGSVGQFKKDLISMSSETQKESRVLDQNIYIYIY